MSRGQASSAELGYSINTESFAFLETCASARHDMTSIEPPDPDESGIIPPSKVLALMRGEGLTFQDFKEVKGVSRGEVATLEACTTYFNRKGIGCSERNVSLAPNILDGIAHVYKKIGLNESNKILVLTPTFGYYFHQFKQEGIGFETFATRPEDGFLPNPGELEAAIVSSGVKALLLCYPNNPTGSVMTEECARAIADIAIRNDIFVISDEAFMNNPLPGKSHFPIAAVEGMMDKSFTITSAAKSVFTGRKIGFCVGRQDIVDDFQKLGGYPTKQNQKVIAAAIEDSPENADYLERCSRHYLGNIELVKEKCAELNQKFRKQFGENIEGLVYAKPYIENPEIGGPYLLDFSGLRGKQHGDKVMEKGLDVAKWLLEDASVGTVPGECFLLDEREMVVRIALNHTQQEIVNAFDSVAASTTRIQAPTTSFQATVGSSLIAASNQNSKDEGMGRV